ncbi:MAG: hypothetical protein RL660_4 [Bacteroidota bacterium]
MKANMEDTYILQTHPSPQVKDAQHFEAQRPIKLY